MKVNKKRRWLEDVILDWLFVIFFRIVNIEGIW